MLELAAALTAGAAIVIGVLCVALPAPLAEVTIRPAARFAFGLLAHESELAAAAAWPRATGALLLALEAGAGAAGAVAAMFLTGLPVLAVACAVGSIAGVRFVFITRAHRLRRERQDAVLDAVRMLRQLLETGAGSVPEAISVLAERGPMPLRGDFRHIAVTPLGRRQAWSAARDRIAEPLFDMLAAAVLIQGPGGGELAPLFAELENTVTGAQEVEREAEALQVQARSASAIIVSLPLAFLLILSTLRSPYLEAFHRAGGELFLLGMLAVMAMSYVWMRRLLRLEGLQRVRLSDA